MTSPPFKEDDNKDIISLLKDRMLNKFCRDFGIYEDICRNMIGLSKEEYYRNSHANHETIASKRKGKDLVILTFLVLSYYSSSFNIFAYSIHIVSAIAVSE